MYLSLTVCLHFCLFAYIRSSWPWKIIWGMPILVCLRKKFWNPSNILNTFYLEKRMLVKNVAASARSSTILFVHSNKEKRMEESFSQFFPQWKHKWMTWLFWLFGRRTMWKTMNWEYWIVTIASIVLVFNSG